MVPSKDPAHEISDQVMEEANLQETEEEIPMTKDKNIQEIFFCCCGEEKLFVGTNVDNIGLWEDGTRERLVQKNSKVWELGTCSMSFRENSQRRYIMVLRGVMGQIDTYLVTYHRTVTSYRRATLKFNGSFRAQPPKPSNHRPTRGHAVTDSLSPSDRMLHRAVADVSYDTTPTSIAAR
ncbi:Topless-related protein 1 [Platanthera guangdongensis]|uniref:Topless-related protein 1 n=1 Tax=Platanthera guangdongensis TaxID=2320717 RepID=A0ABR2M466_9ASPA